MSKGIVTVTPTVTQPGALSVTKAGLNPHSVSNGAKLDFDGPAFGLNVGDTVEFEITSASKCNVIRVLKTAP